MIESYKVEHLNRLRTISDDATVWVEEKIDGSQFSFAVFGGVLHLRSRGGAIDGAAPQKLFAPAVDTVRRMHAEGALIDGQIYRAESVASPRHNVLTYERTPVGGMVLWDGPELPGVESVTRLAGPVPWSELKATISAFVDGPSQLGGRREGIVIKDGTTAWKLVSDRFKEVKHIPKKPLGIESLVESYRTEARWAKAVAHLREAGILTGTPRDIGPLMAEVSRDIERECASDIKDALWELFRKQVLKGAAEGLPDWYRSQL